MMRTQAASPSAMNGWVKAIMATLAGHDVNAHGLLEDAGIDAHALQDAQGRLPHQQVMTLWALAEAATADPCLGVHVAQHISPSSFQAVGLVLMHSGSLYDMLNRLVQYGHHIAGHAPLQLSVRDTTLEVHLQVSPPPEHTPMSAIDATACLITYAARLIHGPGLRPLELRLQRPAPAQEMARFSRAFYRAPIEFGAADNVIVFDRVAAQAPLTPDDTSILRIHDALLSQLESTHSAHTILNQVQEQLITWLPEGEPSHVRMAAALQISARSLQRRLSDAGTTYRAVLQQTRLDQAQTLLRRSNLSISDVAYQLGFSDVSTFTHAFRRWTGYAPRDWRKLHAQV